MKAIIVDQELPSTYSAKVEAFTVDAKKL
jgi:thiol-disulfide isomerase/thioredoxin